MINNSDAYGWAIYRENRILVSQRFKNVKRKTTLQGSHATGKTGKILEFENIIPGPGKGLEFAQNDKISGKGREFEGNNRKNKFAVWAIRRLHYRFDSLALITCAISCPLRRTIPRGE